MPRDQNQSVGAYLSDQMDTFEYEVKLTNRNPKELRAKLQMYCLDEFKVECLILRFVYDMSYQQIADAMHSPTKWVVWETVRSALELLKERGYR